MDTIKKKVKQLDIIYNRNDLWELEQIIQHKFLFKFCFEEIVAVFNKAHLLFSSIDNKRPVIKLIFSINNKKLINKCRKLIVSFLNSICNHNGYMDSQDIPHLRFYLSINDKQEENRAIVRGIYDKIIARGSDPLKNTNDRIYDLFKRYVDPF